MLRPPDVPRTLWFRIRARAIRERATGRARRGGRALVAAVARRGTLSIVGLGCIAAAGWTLGAMIGLIVTGIVLLVIDGRIIT